MPFVVGEAVGPYRIIEQLGQGGMATVFKGYHASLDRYVAIKVLHPAFKENPNFLGRFQREAKVVARMEHPNIVPVYDFAEHEGRPYLVMKYIEGETLKARLSRSPSTRDEVIQILEAVGAALSYAHRQGILHRDVKPSNILIARDGSIYLTDFGLARIAEMGESTLSSDMMVGTPQYISPEQAVGKKELDAGTDIYSFGVVLYELMVGRVPFNADTPFAVIHDHIYSPLPMPRQINPDVPEAVERLLLKALSKERSDRFADVDALVREFRLALEAPAEGTPLATTGVAPSETPFEVPLPSTSEPEPLPMPVPEGAGALASTRVAVAGGAVDASLPEAGLGPKEALKPARAAEKGGRTRTLWIVIPTILLMAFCICVVFEGRLLGLFGNRSPAATSTIQPEVREGLPPTPDDPFAHFSRAVEQTKAGRMEDAQKELARTVELAGEDFGFYSDAGDRMSADQNWIAAAWAYLQAVRYHPDPKPKELANKLHEAVYKAYREPVAVDFIPVEKIRDVDPAMAVVANAEHQLVTGDPLQAEGIILAFLERNPDMPEARLLQGEILLKTRAEERGKLILDKLKNDQTLPVWIRDQAALNLEGK